MSKKFILNADDFGLSKEHNQAVLTGYNSGFLSSASLCANGEAFEPAINDIIPECPNLGIGVHLNIIEGKSLTNSKFLTDKDGCFKLVYIDMIKLSKNKDFLSEVEQEFRAQIEKIKKFTSIDHIDSHVHTHAIPEIFEIVCKLAKEYEIPYVRTQHEELYFVPNVKRHINFSYPVNLLKIALLNTFTVKNRKTLNKFGLKSNDYILGVGYTGMMDAETIRYGLENFDTDCTVEALIHPCCYQNNDIVNSHTKEFALTIDKTLEDKIQRMGFEITNYKKLSS